MVLVTHRAGGIWGMLACALVIGNSFAALAIFAHQILHGAVFRTRRLRLFLGWLGFLPFMISPRLWIAWHNRVHHGNTNKAGVDPDMMPTIEEYRTSPSARVKDFFHYGVGRWMGWIALITGFSLIANHILLFRSRNYLSPSDRRMAFIETGIGWLAWAALASLIGPEAFLFAFVIPLATGNLIVISYIYTNHCLCPATNDENDPLLNSLTVTMPRIIEHLHFNFGYHVEHHLFPAANPRHARAISRVVARLYPDRYQRMSFLRAMMRLARTPRVYGSPTTLLAPWTGRKYPTLLPSDTVASDK